MPGIDSATRTTIASATLTTSNLAAGATYTGSTVDGGAEPEAWPTRIRPIVRHVTATPVHGYLILEESPDNFTTIIETRRVPVPADGQFRTFDWPVHLRYHRLKFVNGNQAQTGMRVTTTTYRGEGSSVDEHDVLNFVLSTTNLAASATFASQTFDLGPNAARHLIRAFAVSDQSSAGGGFAIQLSDDGAAWRHYETADVVGAISGRGAFLESKAYARYARVVYNNGATAQGAFRLLASIVSL